MRIHITLLVFALTLAACQPYKAIETGSTQIGDFSIQTGHSWAQVNPQYLNGTGPTAVWTHDGLALNQVLFYAPLAGGEAMFKMSNDDRPFPLYRSDMTEADIQELIEDSLERFYDTGPIAVTRVAPRELAGKTGFEMEMSFAATGSGIEYRAIAAGVQIEDKLYLVIYLATRLHYFDAELTNIRAILDGVTITQT